MLQEFLFIFVDNCVPRIYWINNVHYDYIGKLLTSKLDSSNQSSWIGSYTMHPCIKNQNWLYAQITKHNYFHNFLRWEVVIWKQHFFIMIHHLNYLYYAQIISIHINVMNDVDTAFCITYDLSLHSPMILKF